MRVKIAVAFVVVLAGVAVYVGEVRATPATGQSTTILAKSLFDELKIDAHTIPANIWQAAIRTHGQSDVYVVDNKFVPGGATGWHSHPGPSLIFVVAGTITNVEAAGCTCSSHRTTLGRQRLRGRRRRRRAPAAERRDGPGGDHRRPVPADRLDPAQRRACSGEAAPRRSLRGGSDALDEDPRHRRDDNEHGVRERHRTFPSPIP